MRTGHTRLIGLVAAALLLGACGVRANSPTGAARPTDTPSAPADTLLVRATTGASDSLTLLHVAAGSAGITLARGALDGPHTTMYTAARGEPNGQTTVRASDPRSGATLRTTSIDGDYQLAQVGLSGAPGGLSPNGRWLVLVGSPQPSTGQEQDRFAVFDTGFSRKPTTIELDGRFSFDAISDDGSALYLTEHLADLSKYQVRLYDLAAGALDPRIIVDKANQGVMRGVRHVALPSQNGEWLFSLYLNDAQGPFIHALNMTNRLAMCVPLLPDGKDDHAKQLRYTLALSPDGTRLYAVNGALGLVSVLDTASPYEVQHTRLQGSTAITGSIAQTVQHHDSNQPTVIAPGTQIPAGYAAISPDGTRLYTLGARGLLALDTRTLKPLAGFTTDTPIDSVALSADGQRLYAGSSTQRAILQLDPASGALIRLWGDT